MAEPPQSSHRPIQSELVLPSTFFDIELPLLEESSLTFNLENAVCSHGFFMMAPNKWDPLTKSLVRPLRLSDNPFSTIVRITQLHQTLLIRVYGTRRLSSVDRETLTDQVRRMLRLTVGEESKVREFHEMHPEAKARGFGRVFRSPTLFEDMVKCILFCNCQWPRTLSMAQSLCNLQLELQSHSSKVFLNAIGDVKSKAAVILAPPTPAIKESKKRCKTQKGAEVVTKRNGAMVDDSQSDFSKRMRPAQMGNGKQLSEDPFATTMSSSKDENIDEPTLHFPSFYQDSKAYSTHLMGDFPSPEEIAGLDEKYLAKRCGLGYRAWRILKLAQGVVGGRIQLNQLEELCSEASSSNQNKVDEILKEINGFGPFTRGNVMMCMGFNNVVPTDSETIRHLKQVRARTTTISTAKEVVEEIYGPYEPYQFLAYWSELWNFYEEWFGKLSEMPSSDYRLITASNMRNKRKCSNQSI